MSDLITVPLAHLLQAGAAERLGAAEVRDYKPGELVTVPRSSAERMLHAGILQANPADPEASALIMKGVEVTPEPETVPADTGGAAAGPVRAQAEGA